MLVAAEPVTISDARGIIHVSIVLQPIIYILLNRESELLEVAYTYTWWCSQSNYPPAFHHTKEFVIEASFILDLNYPPSIKL